jgi:hypothetical protein
MIATHRSDRDQCAGVVADHPPESAACRRRGDDAFREHRDDRQPFIRRERTRRFEYKLAVGNGRGRVALAGPLRPGVRLGAQPFAFERRRQRHARAGALDRKHPPVAGDVPVELVVVLEKTELARGAIHDAVRMLSARQHDLGHADPHAHAVAQVFDPVRLRLAVALDADDLERNHDVRAARSS